MATINVKDASGATVALEKPLAPNQAVMASSRPVVIASDQSAVPVSQSGIWNITVNAALPAGANAIGKLAANSGVNIGTVTVDATQLSTLATVFTTLALSGGGNGSQAVWLPTDQPAPIKLQALANGTTSSRVNSTASNNLTSLKGSAGNIINIDVFNVAAYDVFLKIYNKASAPVVASDTPIWTIPIKAGTGFSRAFPNGKSLGTGIAYAIVKLQADTDATNVAALDLTGSIDWI